MWQTVRAWRWLGLVLLAVLCCAALLQLLAPLVKPALVQALSGRMGRQVCVGFVRVNPWLLRLELGDVAVLPAGAAAEDCVDPAQSRALSPATLRLGHGLVRLDWRTAWTSGWHVAEVAIDRLDVHVVQQAGGQLDIADIVERLAQGNGANDKTSRLPAWVVRNVRLTRSTLNWLEVKTGQLHQISDVQGVVPFVSTVHQDRQVWVASELSMRLNGALLRLRAQTQPLQVPMVAQMSLQATQLALQPLQSVIERWSGLTVADGLVSMDVAVHYQADGGAGSPPALELSGVLDASQLQVGWPGETVRGLAGTFTVDRIRLELASADAISRVIRVRKLQMDRPVLTGHAGERRQIDTQLIENKYSKKIAENQYSKSDGVDLDKNNPPQPSWKMAVADLVVDQPTWRATRGGLDPGATQANEWRVGGVIHATLLGGALNGGAWEMTLERLSWPRTIWQAWKTGPPSNSRQPAYLSFDAFNARGLQVNSEQRTVSLQSAALTGLEGALQRGRDGRLGLRRSADGVWWFTPGPSATGAQPAPIDDRPWQVRSGTVEIAAREWHWIDETPAKPVALLISDVVWSASPVSWPAGPPSAMAIRARVSSAQAPAGDSRVIDRQQAVGQLSLVGQVQWEHPALLGQWDVRGLALEPFAPYFSQGLNARLERGWLSAKGDVRASLGAAGSPSLVLRADHLSLDDVAVRQGGEEGGRASAPVPQSASVLPDTNSNSNFITTAAVVSRGLGVNDPLVNWRQARLRGVHVALAPGEAPVFEVGDGVVTDFFARIALDEQGQLNLAQLQRRPTATTAITTHGLLASTQPPVSPRVRLGPVRMVNGRVQFSDQFIRPHYAADLSALSGTWEGIASAPSGASPMESPSQLELQGRIEGTGALSIRGKFNPLVSPPVLALEGQANDVELKPLTPYSVKYAGHGIEGGTLSASVGYQLDANGQLTASHRLVLNQLRFGDPVQGAPANLPVRLAVALLADRHGVIDLDVPVAGSLKDPEFSVLPVGFRAVGHLIGRAITAPFALLGKALGGALDGHSDDNIRFLAGTDVLEAAAMGPLASLGQALKDRPGAGIEVLTWVDPAGEGEAARAAVQAAMRSADPDRQTTVTPPPLMKSMADDASSARVPAVLEPSWVIDLARQRAVAVRHALEAHGVSPSQIVLRPDVSAPPAAPAVVAAPGAAVVGARLHLVSR